MCVYARYFSASEAPPAFGLGGNIISSLMMGSASVGCGLDVSLCRTTSRNSSVTSVCCSMAAAKLSIDLAIARAAIILLTDSVYALSQSLQTLRRRARYWSSIAISYS